MREFLIGQTLRNHANDVAASFQRRIGQRAHQS